MYKLAWPVVITFLAKMIAALGTVLLGVILGRLYGPSGVGVFSLAQSVLLGASILAKYGLDSVLMKHVGQNPFDKKTLTLLRWAVQRTLMASGIFSCVIFTAVYMVPAEKSIELFQLLKIIILALPAYTLAFVLSGFMKGLSRPASASLMENGFISLISVLLLLSVNFFFSSVVDIELAAWCFVAAAWTIVTTAIMRIMLWEKKSFFSDGNEEVASKKAFFSSSHAFMILSLTQLMTQVVSIWIASIFLSDYDLGLFKAAERLGIVISFVLMVINAVFPPMFAKLFKEGKISELESLARSSVLIGLVLSLPLIVACLFFPEMVLRLFGKEFVDAANFLRIITVGQAVNVITGSVGLILNMTGHEKHMRNIAVFCSVTGILSFTILTAAFGAVGAASALASMLVMQNIMALICVTVKIKIWVLPFSKFLNPLARG
ncbi:oligosaccharide flippase family protein [Kushneria pakistanensis]|uniref:oligosaccharide flippase family protein n=1 Tax=Kushneria pakistanensis TaxID=1508770 RepID=UPI0016747E50|nr:oligosaccharide flippase family protein [Kushneria pakistanensis]